MKSSDSPKTILIVEDDEFLREIMTKKLRRAGYEVLEAMSGERAMEAIKTKLPDLVLLDLILPGMDGFEVMSKLRQQEASAKLPIIVFSNYAEQESIKRSKEFGVSMYLIKAELEPSDVLNRVNEYFASNKESAPALTSPA